LRLKRLSATPASAAVAPTARSSATSGLSSSLNKASAALRSLARRPGERGDKAAFLTAFRAGLRTAAFDFGFAAARLRPVAADLAGLALFAIAFLPFESLQ
jgi:hypothetical protein